MPDTRNHNINVLTQSGFQQFANTTVFFKGGKSIISPAVAQNSSGGYWFDLRKVNLDRLCSAPHLLVRVVPDLFIFMPLVDIQCLISHELMDNRPNSGDVWGIKMTLDHQHHKVELFSNRPSTAKVYGDLISIEAAAKILCSL